VHASLITASINPDHAAVLSKGTAALLEYRRERIPTYILYMQWNKVCAVCNHYRKKLKYLIYVTLHILYHDLMSRALGLMEVFVSPV